MTEIFDGRPYKPEADRISGRIEVESYSSFDLDDLFEITTVKGNMGWVTTINAKAAREIVVALSAWLEQIGESNDGTIS